MLQQFKISSPSLVIIIITIFGFLMQQIYAPQVEMFMLHKGDLLNAPYTILTHMFLHSNFTHLFFNMFGVFIFGRLLERRVTSTQYFGIYFASGIIAGIIGSFIYDSALGASAGVMALVGATAYFFPNVEFYLFGIYPVKLKHLAIFYFVYDFLNSFGINNVANLAHIIGMCAGLSFAYLLSKKPSKSKISRVEAHFSGGKKPDKVVVLHSNKKVNKKTEEDDFSKSMYVSLDESNKYLNKNNSNK